MLARKSAQRLILASLLLPPLLAGSCSSPGRVLAPSAASPAAHQVFEDESSLPRSLLRRWTVARERGIELPATRSIGTKAPAVRPEEIPDELVYPPLNVEAMRGERKLELPEDPATAF